MRERAEPVLKIACLILAALVLYELAGIFLRFNPLHGVVVPALPALTIGTNNPSSGGRGTNLAVSMPAGMKGTNQQSPEGTNIGSSVKIDGTNSMPPVPVLSGTNSVTKAQLAMAETNVVPHLEINLNATNSVPTATTVTNGTNVVVAATGTNAAHQPKPEERNANSAMPPEMAAMIASQSPSPGKRGDDLPPVVQARISRITDSEIFGPLPHPQPMALLGIAGNVAFLRSDGGQTGLVKEGDTLGELKLLKIGINRVLVEQDGQKKELMIFSGYGGESLLPQQKETPDENKKP